MKTFLATKSRTLLAIALTAAFAGAAHADVIMDWNAKADAIAAEKQVLPAQQSRAMSMLHIAMFEAVNAIELRYTPYKLTLSADRSTSKEAAAAVAAYDVLLAIYPDQKAVLDTALTASLSGIPETEGKSNGIVLGKKAAEGVIAFRASDGSNAQESYRPYTKPGVYVPTIVPLFSTIGATTPWVMTSGSQFRPGPPPALDSETWTRDVNEIREIGARNSTVRTAEQTTIGRFWFLVGPRSYNPIIRQAAMAKNMDVVDCARLFALTSIAGNDALVAVFDAKFSTTSGDRLRQYAMRISRRIRRRRARVMVAVRRYPDASGVSVRTLHHFRCDLHGSSEHRWGRVRGVFADQPHCAGRNAQMEPAPGLQRRSCQCAYLCRVSLPLFDRGR